MNHLFIIFSENGKLQTHCEELINSTHDNILIDPKMVFLNGKQVHKPLLYTDDDIDESGILLVYDAHNNAAYDKQKLIGALQNISAKYKHLYVCYHHGSSDSWEEEISNLNFSWAKNPIVKHHYQEPYSFLHEFHHGLKTVDDLILFWNSEEEIQKQKLINSLCYAIDEAKVTKNVKHLDSIDVSNLVYECNLSASKLFEYENLKQMIIDNADEAKFNEAVNNFRTNKITA